MDGVLSVDTVIELLLAISLSAAAGFRVFVPFLVLSAAAVFGHFNLPTDFDWAGTPQALVMFAIACSLEVIGYYIPWLDHALDVVSTPAAVIAGTVVSAAIAPDMNPLIQWTLALVAGGSTAGLTKGLMNVLRLLSTSISGGLTNPLVATVELVAAVGLSLLAIAVPVVAGVVVIALLIFAVNRLLMFLRRGVRTQAPNSEV